MPYSARQSAYAILHHQSWNPLVRNQPHYCWQPSLPLRPSRSLLFHFVHSSRGSSNRCYFRPRPCIGNFSTDPSLSAPTLLVVLLTRCCSFGVAHSVMLIRCCSFGVAHLYRVIVSIDTEYCRMYYLSRPKPFVSVYSIVLDHAPRVESSGCYN